MTTIIPINGQTWLICGGRDFADEAMFNSAMGDLIRLRGCPSRVIHGGATGADRLADEWAEHMALETKPYPVTRDDWDRLGKAAGPIRNQRMMDDGKPQFVVAFPGGTGTADMVRRARAAGVDVAEVRPNPTPEDAA